MTTGMRLSSGSDLISDSTSRPSFLGRLRSRRIKSGRGAKESSPSSTEKTQSCLAIIDDMECVADFRFFQGGLSWADISWIVFDEENFYLAQFSGFALGVGAPWPPLAGDRLCKIAASSMPASSNLDLSCSILFFRIIGSAAPCK